MSDYDTTMSGFGISETDYLEYKGLEDFFATAVATSCAEVSSLMGSEAWCDADTDTPLLANRFKSLYEKIM